MMRPALLGLAALVLPLAGLGGLWLKTDIASRQGTEWDVPVEGFDPRDLLQGHYVQFQYDWPLAQDPRVQPRLSGLTALCLEGTAPVLDRARAPGAGESCPNRVRWEDRREGRLYASQAEARRLQERLWDPALQGVIRIRLRPDGHIMPLRLSFRPRPLEAEASPTPAP